jgi:hypothetical protein
VAKCFAVEAGSRALVFEANSAKDGHAWRAAFAVHDPLNFSFCFTIVVPDLVGAPQNVP